MDNNLAFFDYFINSATLSQSKIILRTKLKNVFVSLVLSVCFILVHLQAIKKGSKQKYHYQLNLTSYKYSPITSTIYAWLG